MHLEDKIADSFGNLPSSITTTTTTNLVYSHQVGSAEGKMAGGAGQGIAFGAKSRGVRVVIFNHKYGSKALAAAVSDEALPYEHLNDFCHELRMILANASTVTCSQSLFMPI
ncbi:hypothetical protein P3S68_032402 [Capsicum galapagoense]